MTFSVVVWVGCEPWTVEDVMPLLLAVVAPVASWAMLFCAAYKTTLGTFGVLVYGHGRWSEIDDWRGHLLFLLVTLL